jgi:hypothetical protein
MVNRQTGRWWRDRRMDRWVDGWMDGWVDGWIDDL